MSPLSRRIMEDPYGPLALSAASGLKLTATLKMTRASREKLCLKHKSNNTDSAFNSVKVVGLPGAIVDPKLNLFPPPPPTNIRLV